MMGAFDEDEFEYDDESERCPDCGAWPEEYHEMDCSFDDDGEDDPEDCGSHNHPGCARCGF